MPVKKAVTSGVDGASYSHIPTIPRSNTSQHGVGNFQSHVTCCFQNVCLGILAATTLLRFHAQTLRGGTAQTSKPEGFQAPMCQAPKHLLVVALLLGYGRLGSSEMRVYGIAAYILRNEGARLLQQPQLALLHARSSTRPSLLRALDSTTARTAGER